MTRVLVLDSEALSALARGRSARADDVRAALTAAHQLNRDVVVPAVILAELYRGAGHNQFVDACLNRESGIDVCDTTRQFARTVGGVLAAANAGSDDLADAHCVAVAVDAGGGVIITGDPRDITRLAASYRNVVVVDI
jgi:predicted nucleic acid-binding protein